MNEKTYDIRAIRFVKLSMGSTIPDSELSGNKVPLYLCLGHFDMMSIIPLCHDHLCTNPLKYLQYDQYVSGERIENFPENCIYSLYILKHIPTTSAKSLHKFWKASNTFILVTKIHCNCEENDPKLSSQIIQEHCRQQTQEKARVVYQKPSSDNECTISLLCAVDRNGTAEIPVECLFYDSMELGDTIAIMKSNSLAAMLEAIQCISSNPLVRNTYTYCCVRKDILQKPDIDSNSFVSGTILPYISTRFSIRDHQSANSFIKKLLKNFSSYDYEDSFVTGTADYSIHWKFFYEGKLLKLLQGLFSLRSQISESFNDVITRVGIELHESGLTKESNNTSSKQTRSFSEIISELNDTRSWLRADLDKRQNNYEKSIASTLNWKYSLLKLLGTLEVMYNNYEMDGLASLIIPSVDAFLIRLKSLRESGNPLTSKQCETDIIKFLNCWTYLTNDIAQLESQLTQHPEFNPVRYYIPAMLLQFILRFVEQCGLALSDENTRSFYPLLIPEDTPELYVVCPLDPRQENYRGKCPLLIHIPIQDLYCPWETAHRVAHEMAHFCEDSARQRTQRYISLQKCMALFLTELWYYSYETEMLDAAYAKCLKYRKIAEIALKNFMEARYPEEKNWYLEPSIERLYQAVKSLLVDERYMERFFVSVNPRYFYEHRYTYSRALSQNFSCIEFASYDLAVSRHIKSLKDLCSECYADISMVLLLACSFQDYYLCVYDKEYQRLRKRHLGVEIPPLAAGVVGHIERMLLVINVINQLPFGSVGGWRIETIRETTALYYPWVDYALQFLDSLKSSEGSSEYKDTLPDFFGFGNEPGELPELIRPEELRILNEYLYSCAKSLNDKINLFPQKAAAAERSKAINTVRKNIEFVKGDCFDLEGLQRFLILET